MIGISLIKGAGMLSLLKKLPEKKLMLINQVVHREGLKVESEVKQSIAGRRVEHRSVDTGRFLNSVSTNNSMFLQSTIFTNVPYAKYLEYGTSKITPPRRHFRNSLFRRQPDIKQSISSVMGGF